MKHEATIYRGILVPANEAPDGETPTCIAVTEEASGFAVWRSGFEGTTVLAFPIASRDEAIETAVREVFRARGLRERQAQARGREKADAT